MSRRKIREPGPDGFPVSRWEDAPELTPPALFEPAYPPGPIERRYVTPQPANGRQRPTSPAYDTAARIARSRANGSRRHVEIAAAARRAAAAQEEPAMPATPDPSVLTPLERLAEAARTAHDALEEKTVADQAWDVAREALEAAWDALEGILGPQPEPPDRLPRQDIVLSDGSSMLVRALVRAVGASAHSDGAPETIAALREIGEAVVANAPKAAPATPSRTGRHGSRPSEEHDKTERASRVLAALERHGGNERKAAAELGMKLNALVMIAKHAGRRAGTSS